MLEELKTWRYNRNHYQDMEFITHCETQIIRIQQLNPAFLVNHSASKQIISKLSGVALRDKLTDKLNEAKYKSGDTNCVNNYITALQEVLGMARIDVEDKLGTKELNKFSKGDHELHANAL